MYASVVWIPPSLCGCQLRMGANFVENSVNDGISYRHPIPFTINKLEIVSVCDAHKQYSEVMTATDHLFDIDNITGESVQRRGYLRHPIENPTPAECLYTHLSRFGGQTHRLDCGCQAHQFVDENKNITYLHHPHHARKCHRHKYDTHDMKQGRIDHEVSNPMRDKGAIPIQTLNEDGQLTVSR